MTQRYLFVVRCLGIGFVAVALFMLAARFCSPAKAQATGAATLTIHLTGARNTKGQIRAALFEGAKGFPGDASQAIQTQAADIDPQSLSAQIVFKGLPEGVYAVSIFHDENRNQKLDKNLLGIPKEGYGASNNPRKKMGPPDFEEAKFRLSGRTQSLEIKLNY